MQFAGGAGDAERSARALLEQHLRAIREQIAARKRQKELESELLTAARQEFERRCERDNRFHRALEVSQTPRVTVECELRVRGVPLESALYTALPEWLLRIGSVVEQIALRPAFQSGAGVRDLTAAISRETLERFFQLHHDYLLPADILEHPELRDPAVQQHVAWLVAQGLLKVRSELLSVELRPQYGFDPGAHELRKSIPAEIFDRFLERSRVWLPPPEFGDYKYSRDAREWAAFQQLTREGVVEVTYSLNQDG
jgi:hypothetical protein